MSFPIFCQSTPAYWLVLPDITARVEIDHIRSNLEKRLEKRISYFNVHWTTKRGCCLTKRLIVYYMVSLTAKKDIYPYQCVSFCLVTNTLLLDRNKDSILTGRWLAAEPHISNRYHCFQDQLCPVSAWPRETLETSHSLHSVLLMNTQ